MKHPGEVAAQESFVDRPNNPAADRGHIRAARHRTGPAGAARPRADPAGTSGAVWTVGYRPRHLPLQRHHHDLRSVMDGRAGSDAGGRGAAGLA